MKKVYKITLKDGNMIGTIYKCLPWAGDVVYNI